MRHERGIMAAFIAFAVIVSALGAGYLLTIIWAIVKVTNHFAP